MELNYTLIIQWSIVVLLLLALVYTMRVIKKEKFTYLENAIVTSFAKHELLIPSWWHLKNSTEVFLEYHRADTYYDWRAHYKELKDVELFNQSIEEVFRDLILEQKVRFDENEAIIQCPLENENYHIIRVEGMGTQNAEKRVYLDAFLLRDNKNKTHLYGQSHSSVLNGMLEGPYFEAVFLNLLETLKDNQDSQITKS